MIQNLPGYDLVLVNSSAGKDSQAMLSYLVGVADAQGVDRARLVVVHADLGRVEWDGTRELAEQQAAAYRLRFEVVARAEDLLDQIVTRHHTLRAKGDTTTPAWPSSAARYCTSDQKTSQVVELITRLVDEWRKAGGKGRMRILNCLGIRAAESVARAKKVPFGPDPSSWSTPPRAARAATAKREAVDARPGVPHGLRLVDRWLPIFDWSDEQVWAEIDRSGLPVHPAYAAGMPRLSCVFCVLAGRKELTLAARLNPGLARAYVAVERQVGHDFKKGLSIAQIAADAGVLEEGTDG